MKVILSKDIPNVGKVGDILSVKDGYARNYLLPQKMAYEASAGNIKRIEQQKVRAVEQVQKAKQQAQELADKLSKVSCTITVEVNDYEKLYGSVTEADIAKLLEDEGFNIDKKCIMLEKPIEELGIFDVNINLHPEVVAKIRLWVAKK